MMRYGGSSVSRRLFSSGHMSAFLDQRRESIRQEIQRGDMDNAIRQDPENAIKQLHDKYALELVSINWENREAKQTIQDNMMTASFYIAFSGDPQILKYQPTTFRDEVVQGLVIRNQISVDITSRIDGDDFKYKFEQWRDGLEYHLEHANQDADRFNRRLYLTIKSMVDVRAEQIHNADAAMAGVGFSTKP